MSASKCSKITINGKDKYFSSKNKKLFPGLKETATMAFAPIYGGLMGILFLFFIWISAKTNGVAHWVTLLISLLSLWAAVKAGLNWFSAKDYIAKNTFDKCDAT